MVLLPSGCTWFAAAQVLCFQPSKRATSIQLAGIGPVIFWEGGSLWLAYITGGNALHRHHAIQVALPLDGNVNFRRSQSTDWVE